MTRSLLVVCGAALTLFGCGTSDAGSGGSGGTAATGGTPGTGGTGGVSPECSDLVCNTPPPNICADDRTLDVYVLEGVCVDDECAYVSFPWDCEQGCANDACTGEPCAGVVCNVPPANTCEDENTIRVYASTGTCADGNCNYDSTTETCPGGCQDGVCTGDRCVGVECTSPPADYCADANNLRVHEFLGTCTNGTCEYQSTLVQCSNGCSNGRCMDGGGPRPVDRKDLGLAVYLSTSFSPDICNAYHGRCDRISDADSKAFCNGQCSEIGNLDLRALCTKSCDDIGNFDLRNYCNRNCAEVANFQVKAYCDGECSSISDSNLQRYCNGTCIGSTIIE